MCRGEASMAVTRSAAPLAFPLAASESTREMAMWKRMKERARLVHGEAKRGRVERLARISSYDPHHNSGFSSPEKKTE